MQGRRIGFYRKKSSENQISINLRGNRFVINRKDISNRATSGRNGNINVVNVGKTKHNKEQGFSC